MMIRRILLPELNFSAQQFDFENRDQIKYFSKICSTSGRKFEGWPKNYDFEFQENRVGSNQEYKAIGNGKNFLV